MRTHCQCFVIRFCGGGGASPSVDNCVTNEDRLDVFKVFQGQRSFGVEVHSLVAAFEIWAAEEEVAERNASTAAPTSTGWRE